VIDEKEDEIVEGDGDVTDDSVNESELFKLKIKY
jgi:hypothetical protein